MEIKERIEQAQANLKKAEQAKTVAETQHKAATEQLADVEKQMAVEGVTPETIDAEIQRLETEIETGLTKVESLIPEV
ncbi:MAG: hypothetical protein ABFC57_06345 [Veillonellales bacterium]